MLFSCTISFRAAFGKKINKLLIILNEVFLLILTIVLLKYSGNAHESLGFLCILIIDVFVCVNVFWTLPLNFSVDNVYFAVHAGCVNRHVHVDVTDRTSCT